jgi:hypothetical protein
LPLFALALFAALPVRATPNRPRIVLILAADGIRFIDAHTPSSVCTPTRYGLLTVHDPDKAPLFLYLPLTSPHLPVAPSAMELYDLASDARETTNHWKDKAERVAAMGALLERIRQNSAREAAK